MAGRANQMSAADAYNMSGSRWSVPFKVLSNRRALDQAFQQHVWTMQQQAQQLAGGERQAHIQGQYRLKEQELQNKASGKSNLEYQVLTQAVKLAQDQGIDMQTPDGQQQFQQIYQALLNQATGGQKGAMMLAGGHPTALPEVPSPVGAFNPMRMLPGYADYGVPKGTGQQLDESTAAKLLRKAGGDKNKARAMARKLGYTF